MGSQSGDGRDVRVVQGGDRRRMAHATITIVLELESTECPSGSARLPDGTARKFHGWLGLAAALDSLARRAAGPVPVAGDSTVSDEGGNENVR